MTEAPVAKASVQSTKAQSCFGVRICFCNWFSRSYKSMRSRLVDSFETKSMAVVMLVLHVMMVLISEALYCYDAKDCQGNLNIG